MSSSTLRSHASDWPVIPLIDMTERQIAVITLTEYLVRRDSPPDWPHHEWATPNTIFILIFDRLTT